MNIGEAIKDLRKKKKVSQKVLSKRIGITQGYLSLIEKGLREPSLDLIKKIAESLDIPQQLLFLSIGNFAPKHRKYVKPIKKITMLIDDLLKKI
jgi:transcriptional regulator with XRE-family HTH domain